MINHQKRIEEQISFIKRDLQSINEKLVKEDFGMIINLATNMQDSIRRLKDLAAKQRFQ